MWAWRRIPTPSLHCPPPFPFAAAPRRSSLSCSSSPKKCLKPYIADREDLLPWLRQKSGQEISSSLSIGNSVHGRSLFASKFIEAGEYVLKVPFSVHLTSDKALPEIRGMISSDSNASNIGQLAVVLLAEMKLGKVSEWAPYIDILPHCQEMHNTVFWSEEELQMLRQSCVYHETLSHKARIEANFAVINPVLGKYPHIFGDYSLRDYMHAYSIVGSRAWDSTGGISLVPFADFLNHDGTSNSVLLTDEDKKCSVVIADRNYASGDQVLIRYGHFSNATLLLEFGFTLPHNIHDQVQICLSVPVDDPLHTQKVKLLNEHKMLKDVSGHISSSGASFTIKEVQSSKGKGRGIPQALRAFSRVLSATSVEELNVMAVEAIEGDGRLARRPFKSRDSEVKAHLILLSHITRAIQDYRSFIKSLKLMDSPANACRFSLRRRMAMDVISGEIRVLESAYSWLRNYCDNLST